jgi:hypothetical protein
MFMAVVEEGNVQVDATPAERFKAPTEVRAKVPEVAVEMVRLPAVLVQADVPPDAKVIAPVELPIPTVFPPVAAKVVFPETLSPPVPWICPEPELTPTAVTAPVEETWNWEELPTEKSAVGEVLPIPMFPLLLMKKTELAARPVSPPGDLLIFNVPLFRRLKVEVGAFPVGTAKERLPEILAVGIPTATFKKAKSAEVLAVPPMRRS